MTLAIHNQEAAMQYGSTKSPKHVQTRKAVVFEVEPRRGYPTLIDPPERFIVLTDPPPRMFVCSGATEEEVVKLAEARGFSFDEDPEPFPSEPQPGS